MITKRRAVILAGILILAGALTYGGSLVLAPWLFDDTDDLLAAMQIERGDWVADVGSGQGDYALPMADTVGTSGRVFAVDIDEDVLTTLDERAQAQGHQNIRTVLGDPDDPKLPHNAVDAVLVRKTYHEFTAPKQMLLRIRQALKPDRRLVMLEDIRDDLVEASRADQVENHDLALRHARDELRRAGYQIEREVRRLRYLRFYDVRYWMLVATPATTGPTD